MRIGIDYTAAIEQSAGIGRYTRGLVHALAKLDSRNEYVLFHASGKGIDDPVLLQAANFRSRDARLSARLLAILWHRLKLPLPVNLFTGYVDLFHSPDYTLPPIRRAATVVTVHDLSYLLYPECADDRLRAYLESVVPVSAARADVVVVDSQCTRNDLVCLLDVAPEKVEVVYPGVDARYRPLGDDPTLEEVRKRWQLDRPFILNVGTLEPRKNQARLIQAYAMLKERTGLDHQLVIVGGRGWLYEDIFRRVNDMGLKQDVRLLGYVGEDDLPAIYNLADLFVFPSIYEGFGLPPLEAMACGTPVVATSVGGLQSLVRDGETGYLVAWHCPDHFSERLEVLLHNAPLRNAMGRAARVWAEQFDWGVAATRMLGVYRGLLAQTALQKTA